MGFQISDTIEGNLVRRPVKSDRQKRRRGRWQGRRARRSSRRHRGTRLRKQLLQRRYQLRQDLVAELICACSGLTTARTLAAKFVDKISH